MRLIASLPVLLLTVSAAFAEVKTKEVSYTAGGTTMKGFMAWDDSVKTARPGVLVVHEWWGHNAYARKRAEQLAGMGYTALAVDMYGDGQTADHPKDAGAFAGKVMGNMEAAAERFEAAMKELNSHPSVNKEKTAAIGYCFGGGVVLNMARMGVDLDGVASFHGSLGAKVPAKKGVVKAKMLVCNGADDPFVSSEAKEAFKKEMTEAGVSFTFKDYPGAVHSFTNPDATATGKKFELPLAYSESADKASWADLTAFLKQVFE